MVSFDLLSRSPFAVRLMNKTVADRNQIVLERSCRNGSCQFRISNRSAAPVRIREIVLFSGTHEFPSETRIHGESFQMLSQTAGTLGSPADVTGFTDRDHYKIPQDPDALTVYSMVTLTPPDGNHLLMGFSSCRRFMGLFRFYPDRRFEVVLDCEGLELSSGGAWQLEQVFWGTGSNQEELLHQFAQEVQKCHPMLKFREIPTGWCSWYHYFANVTEQDILSNLDFIEKNIPQLKYIQIDDGYQAFMGDWLSPGSGFPNGVRDLITKIRDRGFQPAIWVAPFIAEQNSEIFRNHPDWFIKDKNGQPLPSDRVSFGGWRNGPWYSLDGTQPEVQQHLQQLFKSMHEDWGCNYFKLDANFWGALHGGKLQKMNATRIEAYRLGMKAILKGAGDSFILGCNAPMWPSLGMVHGMRVTNDISRKWEAIRQVCSELFFRNWQNNRLWINDPDCILLENLENSGEKVNRHEFLFLATAIFASGGMVLSGDNLTKMSPENLDVLKKLLPPTGIPARFDDPSFRIARVKTGTGNYLCVFNWEDHPATFEIPLPEAAEVKEVWSGSSIATSNGSIPICDMPPHAGYLLEVRS